MIISAYCNWRHELNLSAWMHTVCVMSQYSPASGAQVYQISAKFDNLRQSGWVFDDGMNVAGSNIVRASSQGPNCTKFRWHSPVKDP